MNAPSLSKYRFLSYYVALAALALSFWGCPVSNKGQTEKVSVGILSDLLRHENFFVRSASIKAIGEMGNPARLSSIIPGFRDPVAFVRLFSVESAAQLHGPDTLKLLLAAGNDTDPMVRVAVVKALDDLTNNKGKIDALSIGPILTPFTKDPDPTVHLFAYAALARHGDQEGWRTLLQAIQSSDQDTLFPAIVALGRTKNKEALPLLMKQLEREEAMTRTLAAEALGEIAVKEAYAALVLQVTKDRDASARGAAATSLGKIQDPHAIPILMQALKDTDPIVQLSAAEGLMRLGTKRWDVYEKALGHTDYGVRHFAIGSMHKGADPESLPLLIRALADEAPRVRIAAVRAIGAIGNKNEIPRLEKMLQDTDLSVRAYAAGNVVRLMREKRSLPRETK